MAVAASAPARWFPARAAGSPRFRVGMFALAFLALAVVAGPVASSRIVLAAQQVATDFTADPAGGLGGLLPITSTPLTIGLGAVAAYLLLAGLRTGRVRAPFAGDAWLRLRREPPAPAHPAWRVALWQELNPRPPPTSISAAPGSVMRPALAVRER